jgi:hypothetical protein
MSSEVVVEKRTSIKLKQSTLVRFAKYGKKGDSYEDIFVKIINILEDPSLPKRARVRIRQSLYPTLD